MASCRRGRGCFLLMCDGGSGARRWRWRHCVVLQNNSMGYTYYLLRPERRVLDRRIEISRTPDFYACFFGRGRRGWSLFGFWCLMVVDFVVVVVVRKYFNFLGFVCFWIVLNKIKSNLYF